MATANTATSPRKPKFQAASAPIQKATPKKPADIAQVTLLMDRSGSMEMVRSEALRAIKMVLEDCRQKTGILFALREFDDRLETIQEFGETVPIAGVKFEPRGNTHLWQAVTKTIQMSRDEAAIDPDLKTHHVIIVVTDGESTGETPEHNEQCKQAIKAIDVEATFILLDFSGSGDAGDSIGLKGIRFEHNGFTFLTAMEKVQEAITKISDNIVKKMPPDSGLALPPAR